MRCARGVGTTSVHQCAVKMLSVFFCSFLDLERDVRVPNLFFFSFLSASFCITLVGGGGWLNGIV